MATTESKDLGFLFPLPAPPPAFAPQRLPGVTHKSSTKLVEILKENHTRSHIFFNDKGFHNHASHILLALYQLGGTPAVIEGAWKVEAAYQRDAYPSPSAITDDNFGDHLRKEDYWTAYNDFFAAAIQEKGIGAVLEKCLFTPEYNKPPRRMLNRFLMGVVHPIIHAGYGCEFGLPGMVAEGLAMACVQADDTADMFPQSVFLWNNGNGRAQSVASVTATLSSVGLNGGGASLHALEILAKVANDPAFTPAAVGIQDCKPGELKLEQILEVAGPKLFGLVSAWTVDGTDLGEVYRKIEEVIWMNVVICGVAGWGGRHSSPDKRFNADFFLVHLVTSVLSLHSFVPHLSGHSMSTLLRAYFSTSLLLYVARGRPALPIRDFFASTNAQPRAPGPTPTPHKDAVMSDPTANPWLSILQSTLLHKDDHLAKIQRALTHFDSLWGTAPAGRLKDLKGLDGAEALDGTIFLRIAGLTQDRIGWMREGEENKGWDFQGFFN